MTVEQYVQRWLDSTATTPAADRNRYWPHLEQHILPRLGRCQLAEVIASGVSLLLNHVIHTVDTQTADEVYRAARRCSTRRSPTDS